MHFLGRGILANNYSQGLTNEFASVLANAHNNIG